MRPKILLVLLLGLNIVAAGIPAIVEQVRVALSTGNVTLARQILTSYRSAKGTTPEYLEAFSWLGRGELALKQYAAAEQDATEAHKLCVDAVAHRRLDSDASLPTALGAAIEVQSLAAAAQGRRDQAVVFLRQEVARWHDTSIRPRIQKNLNLLTLEGKPAPALQVAAAVTSRPVHQLASHRGHPVLLFFWAHWCSDCKNEIQVVKKLEDTYGKRGFEVIAPTQHYGYVAGGQDASPGVETAYIKTVFAQYYAGLGNVETPLSEENFANYGVSTTPTMVLLDGQGIVRLYGPGNVSYEALAAKIQPLL